MGPWGRWLERMGLTMPDKPLTENQRNAEIIKADKRAQTIIERNTSPATQDRLRNLDSRPR